LLLPTIVSVVTRGLSDDANGEELPLVPIHMRVYRNGDLVAFHWSLDGVAWKLARVFALPLAGRPVTFRLVAQSPTGDGCTATFDNINTSTGRIDDLRSGQ